MLREASCSNSLLGLLQQNYAAQILSLFCFQGSVSLVLVQVSQVTARATIKHELGIATGIAVSLLLGVCMFIHMLLKRMPDSKLVHFSTFRQLFHASRTRCSSLVCLCSSPLFVQQQTAEAQPANLVNACRPNRHFPLRLCQACGVNHKSHCPN